MSDPALPADLSSLSSCPATVHVILPVRRRYWLHALLFLLTIVSTMCVGARLEANFLSGAPQFATDDDLLPFFWVLQQPSRLLLGIPFSASLLAILLAHEMGHFVYSLRHRVYATLPYFIPAPTLIGTFGAFIRIRSAIRTRDALFDIGISGPIAGYIVAVPVLFAALLLSHPNATVSDDALQIGLPVIFPLLWKLLHPAGALALSRVNLHPMAYAAWVGFFATSLNLLPGGQLDGGHIIYAVAPRAHKTATRFTAIALIPMGLFLWYGWLLWAVVLLLPWMRHPAVPQWPDMTARRRLLALAAVFMFATSVIPAPFGGYSLWANLAPWLARLHFLAK
jgi:membrane-associated protease RseP (regulator of RpoE activity)